MLVCWGLSAENGNYKYTKWSLSNFFPFCLVSMLEQQLRLNNTWFLHSWCFLQENENEEAWEQTTACTVWCYKKKALIAACEGTWPFFTSDLVSVWPRGEIIHSPISVGKLFFWSISFPSDQGAQPPQQATAVLLELVPAKKNPNLCKWGKNISFQLSLRALCMAHYSTAEMPTPHKKERLQQPQLRLALLLSSPTIHAHFQIRFSPVKNYYNFFLFTAYSLDLSDQNSTHKIQESTTGQLLHLHYACRSGFF